MRNIYTQITLAAVLASSSAKILSLENHGIITLGEVKHKLTENIFIPVDGNRNPEAVHINKSWIGSGGLAQTDIQNDESTSEATADREVIHPTEIQPEITVSDPATTGEELVYIGGEIETTGEDLVYIGGKTVKNVEDLEILSDGETVSETLPSE